MGKLAQGQKQLHKHLTGGRLSYKEAVLAKCYECTGGYADGKMDCKVPECPLYGFMPFRDSRKKPLNLQECAKIA